MKLSYKTTCLLTTILACSSAAKVLAAEQDITNNNIIDYQIVAQKLDESRNDISTETGSSTYTIDKQSIDNLSEGEFSPVNDVLLHAPGVAQDSFGQLHVRGDHDDLQYRINGILIPEGISGFGQTLDTHFADKMDLLTGALPAQYGYRTAGVVDITTKTGSFANGGRSSIMAGSNDTLEGNQEFSGSSGPANYYVTGTYSQSDRGIEPPTNGTPIHDDTQQDKEFGYLSYVLNPDARFSFIVGNATNRFEIPNNPGQAQNFTLNGTPNYPSNNLNENQFEHNTYGILALQGVIGDKTDYQMAVYSRDSTVLYKPDPLGDLIFNGIASRDYRESFTNGLQNDYSYHLNENHTIRSGLSFSYEDAKSDSTSSVFTTDPITGLQNSNTPISIVDDSSKGATLAGVYLQDEWKPADKLTINYGARFDEYDAFVSDNQLSPRLGAIYDLTSQTKLHAGYARYFTPPPTELIAPVTLSAFDNTTGAANNDSSSPVKPETDNYYDIGIIQKIGASFTTGVDAYYKQAKNLLDEGQFGQALIFSPFNYAEGYVKGIEFTNDYNKDAFSAYGNLAISQAEGKGIASGQFNFAQDELDYINSHYVHLDHDQTYTASAGAAYTFRDIKYSTDLIYGSGLRDGFANTGHLPGYTQVNLGVAHTFDLGKAAGTLDSKFSVINLFDKVYEIRDGSGIGVGAPQFGPRRSFYVALSKPF